MYEKEIRAKLQQMHDSGMSYDDIAEKTGITKSVVAYCISGSRPIKNPSINLLLKVFPRCKIDLDGRNYISTADHGGMSVQDISVSGNANNFFSPAATSTLISRICDAIMSSDISAETKVKVYQIIKDMDKPEQQQ